jgi:diguanylate cyclase (GGDEF)-like protein
MAIDVLGAMTEAGEGRSVSVPVRAPLIGTDTAACRECWRCVRACPARAIRVVDGAVEIVQERCVSCGVCVSECTHAGHTVRDDGARVDELLESGRPVVAILATEFVAAMHPMTPLEVEAALEHFGFYAAESTLLGEEMVAIQYEARHATRNGLPVIRATCPVVNDWVRKYHPALVGALAPIVPPYVAQARLIKSLYPADTAVVYVSPCYARKDEAGDARLGGSVDAAIDFSELKRALERSGQRSPHPTRPGRSGAGCPEPLKELSLTDGFPRSTLASRDMTSCEVKVVRGLAELDALLSAIEAGEAAPEVVDALNCESCIDGPAVNPGMSLFAKRNLDATERVTRARSPVPSRELLRHLPAIELRRTFVPAPVREPSPTRVQIDEALAHGAIRCVDALTGLSNRRVLSDRIVEELARNERYGTPASLLMIDVDHFERIRSSQGRVAGDASLIAVANVLRSILRACDVPARYGIDEFAVVLPGVGKTEAFAVAEKLREAIEDSTVLFDRDGVTRSVDIRVSVGVATCRAGLDALSLLDAADRALRSAKERGRNQVRLAPG